MFQVGKSQKLNAERKKQVAELNTVWSNLNKVRKHAKKRHILLTNEFTYSSIASCLGMISPKCMVIVTS